jgi:hypothetical protein
VLHRMASLYQPRAVLNRRPQRSLLWSRQIKVFAGVDGRCGGRDLGYHNPCQPL